MSIAIGSLTKKAYELQTEIEITPTDAITIRIAKKGEDTALTETVYVGDPLVLRITGKASHSLKPVQCEAYKKGSIANKYTLWDNTGCTSSDGAIMSSNWKTINDHTIEIDMFAFRFVDSLSVIIECSAYVCPIQVTTCGESITNCLTTAAPTQPPASPTETPTPSVATQNNKRRRRSGTQNDFKENIASTSFTVVDRDSDLSGCEGLSLNITVYFTTLITCLFIIGRD